MRISIPKGGFIGAPSALGQSFGLYNLSHFAISFSIPNVRKSPVWIVLDFAYCGLERLTQYSSFSIPVNLRPFLHLESFILLPRSKPILPIFLKSLPAKFPHPFIITR